MWIFSLLLTTLYCLVYAVFFRLFPYFFNQPRPPFSKRSIYSIGIIVALSALAYLISYHIPDIQLGNRFLHAFGGGFLAFLTCWLIVRDTKIKISKFRFFVFSLLIVTALGVGNELLEFFLQTTTGYPFSDSIIDTWLDLTSNTVGALITAVLLTPWLSKPSDT